ncbi:hypothetical protein [Enterococcus avium]|uniref:hypothetical protein n=1 Tax=Enterococcus avium TaxID=33945 RepID=UPI003DA3B6EC
MAWKCTLETTLRLFIEQASFISKRLMRFLNDDTESIGGRKMINNDLAIDRLQDLILTSVNLTEWQKEQIKEAIRLLGGEMNDTKI